VLNSGERVVAVSPSPSALESIDKGNPLAVVYPEEGAILMIAPSAVLASAPHPNAGRLFLEFLLGPAYAEVTVKSRGESLRPDVPALPGFTSFRQVKTVHLSVKDVLDGIPKVTEQWRDTFGG
jgi:iron(III) transport system substrate-binding protein